MRPTTIRQQVALALFVRLPRVSLRAIGIDAEVRQDGWRVVALWSAGRVGSMHAHGRCVAVGARLDEAERRLLAEVSLLPLRSEAS